MEEKMNVFEELVDELKGENLLEETVIEIKNHENGLLDKTNEEKPSANKIYPAVETFSNEPSETSAEAVYATTDLPLDTENSENSPVEFEGNHEDLVDRQVNEKEFYRKRAVEEVSGLQMVEHVISGVEREQMKALPLSYDDLAVKKSLHAFLQVAEEVKSTEHAQAEFSLMQETENWCSALSARDKRITIAHLRRYCETTKPPLSSQALISLAKFYRNLPFSESVRNKFDLVVTRLFSKDIGNEKRLLVFNRQELSGHLTELYAEWSSIQFYSTDDNDGEIKLTMQKFDAFVKEAQTAKTFDELIENQFFTRLRDFKKTTHELFFAPSVAAAAIECNINIGNRYVDLIEQEREQTDTDNIQDKYGFLHDQTISDATSKTLQLVELLKEKVEQTEIIEPEETPRQPEIPKPDKIEQSREPLLTLTGVNRWLLAATILVAVVCGGLYYWANFAVEDVKVSQGVQKVYLEGSLMEKYLQTARISNETFFGVVLPEWEKLSAEQRQEFLKGLLEDGKNKGYTKVLLLDQEGNSAGQATPNKVEANGQ